MLYRNIITKQAVIWLSHLIESISFACKNLMNSQQRRDFMTQIICFLKVVRDTEEKEPKK